MLREGGELVANLNIAVGSIQKSEILPSLHV
jgi:hypothetical protein